MDAPLSGNIIYLPHPAPRRKALNYGAAVAVLFLFVSRLAVGQALELRPTEELKRLSVEELMQIEVTSVSKRPEKLTEVASAIQVITREDIHRSGATSIPEALRLAPNLQVAQLNSSAWIISARGFNATFSNKLLVMIDGRTVYSPLFAGVFWDVQHLLLDDIDRIEVVSGPGGALWGENAVNGVINIITRKSTETEGLYATAAGGSYLRDFGAVRYGGKLGNETSYRVYAQHADRNPLFYHDGRENSDKWRHTQTGFRIDWDPSEKNTMMVEGNFYVGSTETIPKESTVDGQNVLARWSHTGRRGSDFILQAYYDRTWRRDVPSTISDGLQTYDVDFQHRFSAGHRHALLWGIGYRLMHDQTLHATQFVGLLPTTRDMSLFSSFVQDEISIIPERLRVVAGMKLQHNDFSGFEWQPSARIAWTGQRHTLWAAASRAVRAPSRIDVDYFLPVFPLPPEVPSVAGGPNFTSEKVTAAELGYRIQPGAQVSLSVSAFVNRYYDLYSVDSLPGTRTYQIQNGTEGNSRGAEVAGAFQVSRKWRVRWGYTFFLKNLRNKPGHIYDYSALGNDAQNIVTFHSILDLPANFQFDNAIRYIDRLPKPHIPDYFTFDTRVAWSRGKVGISVVGQNLWKNRHAEFLFEIPRSIYGRVTCRI